MHAKDVMSSPAITVHVNDSLSLAAKRMWDADVGALAVVNDDGILTGMITDRDICMAGWTQGRPFDELLVNAAMSRKPVFARPEDGVGDVEELMAANQVRRIPIVDVAGIPIGVVSLNDLAIESAQPDTLITHAAARLATTLAAICRRRGDKQHAA